MQDLEFTIERGRLWMLQTRSGKRTAKAALKIAVDMAAKGLIGREEAVSRIDPASLDQLLHPTIDPKAERQVIGSGLPASPGAATGEIVFSSNDAEELKAQGRKAILVRVETSPEDIHGMHAAEGILTTRGGMTSHAAVVARGMGKPCVSGAGSLRVDMKTGVLIALGVSLKKGDVITIDGGTGQVLKGAVPMLQPELSGDFAAIMSWADALRRMKVRTNAETPADARMARSFGAEGIGLCRTEHMFFDDDRIVAMREMILSDVEADRRAALARLLPMQRSDFLELFEIMAGLPVTIRLLDPPLHEFLPKSAEEIAEVAAAMKVSAEKLRQRTEALHEFNPMLGHRGCRLAVSYPEIAEMQARAIFEAAAEAGRRTGAPVVPEVMVPLVGLVEELDFVKARIDRVASEVAKETGTVVDYLIGTMIELPRAAIRAGSIAERRRVLLLRHQRSHADHLRHLARRRLVLPGDLPAEGNHRAGPLRLAGHRRRRRAGAHGRRQGQGDSPRLEARHLRGAWRRPRLDPLLRDGRAGLRLLLAFPRADRPPGSRPGSGEGSLSATRRAPKARF